MANFNKVVLVGRLTRDPETRSFNGGGKVANFGIAVNNRKKNTQTGQWEDDPCFIDCAAFNRGENGRLADVVAEYTHKGSQVLVEGKLHLETWDDKHNPGQKRSKHKLVVDSIELLDGRPADGTGTHPQSRSYGPPARQAAPQPSGHAGGSGPDATDGEDGGIPF